jgi:hypothetical protein
MKMRIKMVRLQLNRILAALISGGLLAIYINHDYSRWGRLGRDAFLTFQSGRFDRYMGPNHPLSVSFFGSIAVATMAILCYEFLSAALAKILPTTKLPEDSK